MLCVITLQAYKFSEQRVKVNYSIIPVVAYRDKYISEVSPQDFDIKYFKNYKHFSIKDKDYKLEIVLQYEDLEKDEKKLFSQARKAYEKHWFYKFKFIKEIRKKEKLIV